MEHRRRKSRLVRQADLIDELRTASKEGDMDQQLRESYQATARKTIGTLQNSIGYFSDLITEKDRLLKEVIPTSHGGLRGMLTGDLLQDLELPENAAMKADYYETKRLRDELQRVKAEQEASTPDLEALLRSLE